MSKQMQLRGQAILMGMVLTMIVLFIASSVVWSATIAMDSGVDAISSPQIGPGGGNNDS